VAPDDVGAWIELGQDQYTVEPGRRVEIPFELTVPRDATPGDHAGGIVGANTEPEQVVDAEGATVDLMRRIGARVYLRVEGPLEPQLDITELDLSVDASVWPFPGGEAKVTYRVTNTGNVRLTPRADLDLEGLLGHGVATVPGRTLPELLPGSSVLVEVETDASAWPLDRVEARLDVQGTNAQVTRTVTTWSISPSLIVIVGLLVALGVWWQRRRRRQRQAANPPDSGERATKELVPS
jgi:uncharacterized membrane protein